MKPAASSDSVSMSESPRLAARARGPQQGDPIAATRTMTTSTSVWYRQAPEPSQAAIMAQSHTVV